MRRQSLITDYEELREAGSQSDFPNILGSVMYRRLIDWAQTVPSPWRQYAAITEAPDKRLQNSIIGYEAEDLLPIGEESAYQDSKLADAAFSWKVDTYGRAFSINRDVILNDDLGYIRQQPKRFGRAAARSLSLFAARTLLEGNGATFDGVALFHATHGNLQTGAGTVFSGPNLQAAITGMRTQTVLSTFNAVQPKILLVPPALEFTAKQLLNSAIVIATGVPTAAVTTLGNTNVLQGALDIVVDPFLTSATAWYVLADPNDVPTIMVGFLNGRQTPVLLVEKPTMTQVAGPDDEYEFEFDVMRYKVRYDYGGTTALWWGGVKYAGA